MNRTLGTNLEKEVVHSLTPKIDTAHATLAAKLSEMLHMKVTGALRMRNADLVAKLMMPMKTSSIE
jgi:hypothetical protein